MKRACLVALLALGAGAVRPGTIQLAHPDRIGPHCLTLSAQSATLPAPGNPSHQEPPPGESCVHDARDSAHNCTCHRECKQNTDDEGNDTEGAYVQEDPKCRVYCFKDHCHCPVENCD